MGKAGAIHPALGTEPPRPAPKWRLRGGRDRVCVNVTLGRGISSPKPGPGPSSRREGGREGGGGAAAGFRVGLGLGCEHKLRRRPRGERGRRAARPAAVPGAARGAARAAGGGGRRREAACAQQEVRAMRFGAAPAPRRVPGGHGLPPLRPRRRGSRCFLTGVVRPRRLCWCLSPWDAPTRPGPRRPAAAEAPAFGGMRIAEAVGCRELRSGSAASVPVLPQPGGPGNAGSSGCGKKWVRRGLHAPPRSWKATAFPFCQPCRGPRGC
uniref:Uncharacterized protein n=1 Tax=Myotis myotis TaxID=51298 RepID=A0A7J7RM44_MYOMY|nr:hypothetical protein mMyoMyo1_010283 [Myotis myotis]